jgi:DNA repair protein RecN (Recombination protein N)
MLRELHISNLAVISDAKIELGLGLNCFTGATGAGKSLIIGAVELLLGMRSAAEMLRSGAEEGRVSGVFDVSAAMLKRIEESADISIAGDGGEILITRRLHASGRSSINLNGNPITLGMLKQIAEHLVDVHGQHDHQFLLKAGNQLEVLDQFGSQRGGAADEGRLTQIREEYQGVYLAHGEAKRRMEELAASRNLRQQQLELYRYQAEEIDKAEILAGEFEELSSRSSVLRNLEKLKKEAGAVHGALYEMDGSVLERAKMMSAVLSELAMVDQQVGPIAQSMREAMIGLEETAFDLSRYLDRLELDPGELAEVDERLNVLNRVLNKYGGKTQAVLAFRAEIGKKIEELSKESEDFGLLAKKIEPLEKELRKLGEKLSAARQAAGKRLTPLIEKELAELGMEKAKFSVAFERAAEPMPSGVDQIEFVAQTNPGQSPQPLRKIASGGELSRIMLALKGILAQTDGTSVLVFDEIDANVGGRLGSVIGMKLRELAQHHQVLCITHLPQIACFADRHLTVRKIVKQGQTETSVTLVSGVARIDELAEMIGGQRVSDVTRAQAEEMLQGANGRRHKGRTKAAMK